MFKLLERYSPTHGMYAPTEHKGQYVKIDELMDGLKPNVLELPDKSGMWWVRNDRPGNVYWRIVRVLSNLEDWVGFSMRGDVTKGEWIVIPTPDI